MKLIHRTITTLGITTLLGGLTHAVQAQPGPRVGVHLYNNHAIIYNPGRSSVSQGTFYYNPNQGGIYQGSIYSPGLNGISQGTFYNPSFGGISKGLFYNPSSGGVFTVNFFNPNPSVLYQRNFSNPTLPFYNPSFSYNQSSSCSYQGNLHDWGAGCFGKQDYRRAIQAYNQAITRNPKLADAYNKRALARFIIGDKQGTIEDLQKAANLYFHQGDKSRYQETLETIREIQGDPIGGTSTK